jgi:hypothetical protein
MNCGFDKLLFMIFLTLLSSLILLPLNLLLVWALKLYIKLSDWFGPSLKKFFLYVPFPLIFLTYYVGRHVPLIFGVLSTWLNTFLCLVAAEYCWKGKFEEKVLSVPYLILAGFCEVVLIDFFEHWR